MIPELLAGTPLLVAFAVALRAAGVALRRSGRLAARLPGWLLCLLATWAASGVAGAWFPVWPVPALAVAAALSDRTGRRPWTVVAADGALLLAAAFLSVPPLPPTTALALAAALAAAWGGVEAASVLAWRAPALGPRARTLGPRARTPGPRARTRAPRAAQAALGLLAVAGLWLQSSGWLSRLRPAWEVLPHLGVTTACGGEALRLSTGARAWLTGPAPDARDDDGAGDAAPPGALVLHGASPAGARQPSACALRRALAAAGYRVLAVDHPGYGETPAPGAEAPVRAWDPVPSARAGLERLRSEGADPILAVGHSMGTRVVPRLVRPDGPVDRVVLFGAALDDPASRDRYWYRRFHADRGMRDSLPFDKWRDVRARYDAARGALAATDPADPPVVFATFGHEWENVASRRDGFYAGIRGDKTRWHLDEATHYFSTWALSGVALGDVRVTRRLARRFRLLAD